MQILKNTLLGLSVLFIALFIGLNIWGATSLAH